jgi:hypothetical protein
MTKPKFDEIDSHEDEIYSNPRLSQPTDVGLLDLALFDLIARKFNNSNW